MNLILDIDNACNADTLPDSEEVESWVSNTLIAVSSEALPNSKEVELNLRVVDIDEISTLNATYRKKDGPTNVLSFPFEFPPGFTPDHDYPTILGDIVACAEIISQEAVQQQKPLKAHWAHMITHGTLHLLGYDHQNDLDAKKMEDLEIKLLAQMDFPNPYISHETITL